MVKSVAQEQFDQQYASELEIAYREIARKSHDVIRVYNPLDQTFAFMYDRYWHRIPSKSYKDLERYLAMHFFKKICDKMIGDQILLKGEDLKKLRENQMGADFLDKYEENVQIWDKVPKLNDPDLIEQIKQVVLIGIVEEYGTDEPEIDAPIVEKSISYVPLHEQIFSTIDKKIVPREAPQVDISAIKPIKKILNTEEAPLYKSKATLEQEAKEMSNV